MTEFTSTNLIVAIVASLGVGVILGGALVTFILRLVLEYVLDALEERGYLAQPRKRAMNQ